MNEANQAKLVEKFPGLFTKVEPAMEPYDQRGIECGDGWYDLIECLAAVMTFRKIHNSDENNFRIAQIKEKFGGLRVYLSGKASDHVRGAIHMACQMSSRICEVCGQPGELREDKPWIRTLCDTHAAERD
jgi:hypothetical protein